MQLVLNNYSVQEAITGMGRTHGAVDMTPNNNAALRFRTLVPKGWLATTKSGAFAAGIGIATPIAIFCESGDASSPLLIVTQTPIPVEVPVKDWVALGIEEMGWKLLEHGWQGTPRGPRWMGIAQRHIGSQLWLRRITAFVDSGRLFRIDSVVLARNWQSLDPVLWLSATSFELVTPTDAPIFERHLDVQHPCEARISLRVPTSWQVEPVQGSAPGRAALDALLRLQGDLCAQLHVRLDAHPGPQELTLPQLEQRTNRLQQRAGIVPALGATSESNDGPTLQGQPWLGTQVRLGNLRGRIIELRCGYLRTAHGVYTLFTVAPRRMANTMNWLRAKRTFEIARDSLSELAAMSLVEPS